MKDLTVVLPAYNEEESLGLVIDEIKALPVQCHILVIDNNSTDDTYNVAISKGVKVVTEELLGKGNAMRKGFELASTPYVIMMNSDYTYPADNIIGIRALLAEYDVVIGYRYVKEDGSMSLINSVGNKMLSLLASALYGIRVHDVCTGLWGFKKGTLDRIIPESEGFTLEAELFVRVAEFGDTCKLIQIPTSYRSRLNGSKAKLKVWDGFKIGWFLIKNRWRQ